MTTRTINITPNWEGMRKWVLHVYESDPETAREIAKAMGCEAPDLPDEPSEPHPDNYRGPDGVLGNDFDGPVARGW